MFLSQFEFLSRIVFLEKNHEILNFAPKIILFGDFMSNFRVIQSINSYQLTVFIIEVDLHIYTLFDLHIYANN